MSAVQPALTLTRMVPLAAAVASVLSSGCASLGPPRFGSLQPLPVRKPGEVTFVVMGDMGRFGAAARKHLACHSRRVCRERDGCDFTAMLGDNLYDAGLETPADACRLEAMVAAYPGQRKLLILGNHDYHKLWPTSARAEAQLSWIADHQGDGVRGAFHFYDVSAGPVQLWGLDSNLLVRSSDYTRDAQVQRFAAQIRKSDAPWRIVMGHHPYLSRGKHGNAGEYLDGGFSLWSGGDFKQLMQYHVLGHAQLYLAGHDHNLQFYASLEGKETAQLVSGSSSACTPPPQLKNDARPELLRYGYAFALVDATAERLTITLFDERGEAVWQLWRTRAQPAWHYRLLTSPTPMAEPCSRPTTACRDAHDERIETRYRSCMADADAAKVP